MFQREIKGGKKRRIILPIYYNVFINFFSNVHALTQEICYLNAPRQSTKYRRDVPTFLHTNDTNVIPLIDPQQKRFVHIVKDSTSGGPEIVVTGSGLKAITWSKQEVVCD